MFSVIVAALAVVQCVTAQVVDWPQFGRTPTFQSYNDASPSPVHKEWVFSGAKNRLVASPAVYGGRVYLGSDDGHMYCLNQTTGEQLWAFKILGESENGVRSSPAVAKDGSVYFGGYDKNIYHISREGTLLWSVTTKGPIYGPATITADGSTVLIGTEEENCLYALHAEKQQNQVKWTACGKRMIGAMNSGPAVDPDSGIIIMNNYDGIIRGIQLTDGKIVWEYQTAASNSGGGSASIANGIAYIGSWDKYVHALEVTTGRELWKFNANGVIESHTAYHNGIVYATAEDSHSLFAINATTGTEIWTFSDPAQEVNGSPSLTDKYVFFGANDKYLYAVDRTSGKEVFKFETCANVFSSPAIADNGMLYFTCNSGTALESNDPVGIGKAYALNPALHI